MWGVRANGQSFASRQVSRTCHLAPAPFEEEDTCMSFEEEDACMSYEEEGTCHDMRAGYYTALLHCFYSTDTASLN